MGNLEKESKKRTRRSNIQKVVLQSVAMAGLLSVALLAPNALQVLKMFGYKPNRRDKEILLRSRSRLIKQGFLKYENDFITLTDKGKEKLYHLQTKDSIVVPKKWDKKWRIVIFDIKEYRRVLRDKLRLTLISIGFKCLQRSVWVFPYDCEDFITLLKADFKIGKDILYIIADTIENDKKLKEYFGLH
ncbi:MAG: hypothetical protein NUV47_00465 [Patescibacteria group bacterium]|nr:hypothetical protein [Patescibacteria group bacterium]